MKTMDIQDSSPKQTFINKWLDKVKKISRQDIIHWLRHNPVDTFLIMLILVGVVLAINPLPSVTGVDKLVRFLPASMRVKALSSIRWMAHDGGAQISGTVFFVVGAGVGFWRVRQHSLNNKKLWSTVCPNCQTENRLRRVHRTSKDKLLNTISIPTKRYRCPDCKWQGLRIDENSI